MLCSDYVGIILLHSLPATGKLQDHGLGVVATGVFIYPKAA